MPGPRRTTSKVPRRRARSADRAHPIYELDLFLVDSQPLIWRSLAVPADFTLHDLHLVIQCVMPWEDCHLHQFHTKAGKHYHDPPRPDVGDLLLGDELDENRATLGDVYEELQEKLAYEYDFGDSWIHALKLITTHADPAAFEQLPICLGGENAAPPEDSGGIFGYYDKLAVLQNPDPDDEWHDEVLEWLGEDFDATAFDRDAANTHLSRVFRPKRSR